MRLAASRRVGVETVNGSEILQQLGGVGCLLRYRPGGFVSPQSSKTAEVAAI